MGQTSRFASLTSFLSSIRGDLANITSPPQFLAPESVIEICTCWTERPSLYSAPALEPDPQRRALLVLKWLLASHRRQFYVGANVTAGLKKPLNAFLGELFLGEWSDGKSTVKCITEQVSHHPPISACYTIDEKNKVWCEGYTRVDMSFNGTLNVNQTGHSILHLDNFGEQYLIPMPGFKVKGFLSGHLYPEIYGTYFVPSTSGYVSEIQYSGKGLWGGEKNHFEAKVYKRDDPNKTALYTVSGCWSDKWSIYDGPSGALIESWIPEDHPPTKLRESAPIDQQDMWETHRAWKDVTGLLKEGEFAAAGSAKLVVEDHQRQLRNDNPDYVTKWEPLFFTTSQEAPSKWEELASVDPSWKLGEARTKGVWGFDRQKARTVKRPYHEGVNPARSV